MLNIVEKYSVEAPAGSEEGVIAIEYVLMAVLAAGVLVALRTPMQTLGTKLSGAVNAAVG